MNETNMNFEKLTICDNLFINCNITYLQSAVNYYAANNEDFILLYLADCELKYADNIDESYAQNNKDPAINNDDPFYYQPLRLYNSKKDVLFNERAFGDLFKFLKTGFNIKTKMLFSPLTKEYLTNNLQGGFKNNELYIINVDLYHCSHLPEYYTYCSFLPLYYGNIHNRHGLLVKGFDIGNNTVEVIDNLLWKPCKVNFDEVAAGFNSNSFINLIIKINGGNFSNNIDYTERWNAYLKNSPQITFIDDFRTDLKNYVYKDLSDQFGKGFHLSRYYISIRFQLIPYLKMRLQLWLNMQLHLRKQHLSSDFLPHAIRDIKESIWLWKQIEEILWVLIPRENDSLCKSANMDNNADPVFKNLDRLQVLEDNIIRDIEKLK